MVNPALDGSKYVCTIGQSENGKAASAIFKMVILSDGKWLFEIGDYPEGKTATSHYDTRSVLVDKEQGLAFLKMANDTLIDPEKTDA